MNGIWSRQFCDISVSKLEGIAFLFRIPNFQTRNRVVNQRLWNIEGQNQTMFVAKWVPGVIPAKPELSSAPIWLELRDVPFQFFNEDGLEYIAGLVGEPKFLHPATANKTNLEVAKVFTLIDPRKPLPEAVNAQFQTGEVRRIRVSSPWMPQICSHCKEIGHSIKRCSSAPISCSGCNSSKHTLALCPRLGKKKRKQWVSIEKQSVMQGSEQVSAQSDGVSSLLCEDARSLSAEDSGKLSAVVLGKLLVGASGKLLATSPSLKGSLLVGESSGAREVDVVSSGVSGAEPDSSDTLSSEPDCFDELQEEDDEFGYQEVVHKSKNKKQLRNGRGKGLKIN